jgi:hypothetical protein
MANDYISHYGGSNHCVRKKARVRSERGAEWHIKCACHLA